MIYRTTRIALWTAALAAVCALWFWTDGLHTWGVSLGSSLQSNTITISNAQVVVEVVDTPITRARGLSGREALPAGRGMLFDMGEDGLHGIWMKDMRFAIDIVWMRKDGTIVHIERNASPESYPKVFAPPEPAYFVLELPAGYMAGLGVGVGEKIEL